MIVDENYRSSENIHAQVEGRITTRWRRPGMRRDLLLMVRFCYLGVQELGRAQAPQLEAVRALDKPIIKVTK